MKNKILSLAFVAVMLIGLGACGVKSSSGASAGQQDISVDSEKSVSSKADNPLTEASSAVQAESEQNDVSELESRADSHQGDEPDSEIDTDSNIIDEDKQDMVDYVDGAIQELYKSEDFVKASKEDKIAMVSDLLDKLEKDGYVKNVHYDEMSQNYSFQYANGVYSGISFQDFSKRADGLFMN